MEDFEMNTDTPECRSRSPLSPRSTSSLSLSNPPDPSSESPSNLSTTPTSLKWSRGLSYLLNDPQGRELFEKHLEERKCSNPLKFLWACEGFRETAVQNPSKMSPLIRTIFKHFIENQELLGLEENTRSDLVKATSDAIIADIDIFKAAEEQVLNHVREHLYPKFLQSALYQCSVNREVRPYFDDVAHGSRVRHPAIRYTRDNSLGQTSVRPDFKNYVRHFRINPPQNLTAGPSSQSSSHSTSSSSKHNRQQPYVEDNNSNRNFWLDGPTQKAQHTFAEHPKKVGSSRETIADSGIQTLSSESGATTNDSNARKNAYLQHCTDSNKERPGKVQGVSFKDLKPDHLSLLKDREERERLASKRIAGESGQISSNFPHSSSVGHLGDQQQSKAQPRVPTDNLNRSQLPSFQQLQERVQQAKFARTDPVKFAQTLSLKLMTSRETREAEDILDNHLNRVDLGLSPKTGSPEQQLSPSASETQTSEASSAYNYPLPRRSGRREWQPVNLPSSKCSTVSSTSRNAVTSSPYPDSSLPQYIPCLVVYNEGSNSFPFSIKIPKMTFGGVILSVFKKHLPKRGAYRYFFKTTVPEVCPQIVHQEISDDNQEVPLHGGRIHALVQPM